MKYNVIEIWEKRYGKKAEVYDYAGRKMLKSACGNKNSSFEPTMDHIRPLAKGGTDTIDNIVLCNWETNQEKADKFPHWTANNKHFRAEKTSNRAKSYNIVQDVVKCD